MRIDRTTLRIWYAISTFAVVTIATVNGQSAPPRPAGFRAPQASGTSAPPSARLTPATTAASVVKPRALLDQYCVSCHNDRMRTANLSVEKLDLTTARKIQTGHQVDGITSGLEVKHQK